MIEKGGLLYIPALDLDYNADDEDDAKPHDQDLKAESAAFLGFDVSAHNTNYNGNDKQSNKEQSIPDSDGFAAGVLATPTEWGMAASATCCR